MIELQGEAAEKYWRSEVELSTCHNGSLRDFCKSRGIAVHKLYYWRKKFGKKPASPKKLAAPPFIAMKVAGESAAVGGFQKVTLLDPQWCAEFIQCLFKGIK